MIIPPLPHLAYRHRLFAIQKAMGKTRSDLKSVMANHSIILFVTGVMLTIMIGFVLSPGETARDVASAAAPPSAVAEFMRSHGISFEELGRNLGIFLWPLALVVIGLVVMIPIFFVSSIVKLVKTGLAMRIKVAGTICPRCNAEHPLLENVRDFTCPGCSLPFRVRSPGALALLACPHCAAEFGATAGSSDTTCPCCEVTLAVSGTTCTIRGEAGKCAGCGEPMPARAEFCPRCFTAAPGASFVDFEEQTRRLFREDAFDGFAHDGKVAGQAAGALLARNAAGTLADARRRIARAGSVIDPMNAIPYLDASEMDFACLQLIGLVGVAPLRPAVARTIRDADRLHAKWLRTVVSSTKAGKATYDTGTMDIIGRHWVGLRMHLIDELEAADAAAAKGFARVHFVVQSKHDKWTVLHTAPGRKRIEARYGSQMIGTQQADLFEDFAPLEELASELEGPGSGA